MSKPKLTIARLKALDHHIRSGKKLTPRLRKFGSENINNWPKNPNRYFRLYK